MPMLNSIYLFIPFPLQMICMAVDEVHYHRKRGLPRWERVGHPLDTLTVLACFVWLLVATPNAYSLIVYAGLSVISCLFVTKDEPVHSKYCESGEHWLHAMLFIMHPLVLLGAGLLWPALSDRSLTFIRYSGFERMFLLGNTLLIFVFGLYQYFYWNFIWSPRSKKQARLITQSTIS
jgi:hypothetical protein